MRALAKSGYLYLLWVPAVLTAIVLVLPLAYLVMRTLEAGAGVWDLVLNPRTLNLLLRTVGLVAAVTSASVALSLPLAWLTTRSDLPLRKMWTVLAVLPLVIPSYVGAFTFLSALGPRGMLQQLMEGPLGIERLPDIYGFPGAFVVLTLCTYPYLFLTVRGALVSLDPALEEASHSLGHSKASTLWNIILPQLRPAIASGGLLVALYTLRDFGAVSMMQYDAFTRVIFVQYQTAFDRTYAAALSLILVGISVWVLMAEMRTRARYSVYYRSDSSSSSPPAQVPLGIWKGPALVFCGMLVALALGIPTATISYWLVRGILAGEILSMAWIPAWNSFHAAAVAAAAAGLAAVPVAYLAVRRAGWFSHAIERLTYVGYALPGVALGLALVFFGANYASPLYQTFAMLILAYVIQFVPQAVGTVRASLLQINPRYEEAARTLGRSGMQVLASITWPLVRPGLLGGVALVFLSAMKELPITLMLRPTGFETLATLVWGATEEAFYARAAVPSLLLILVSSLSVAGLLNRIKR